MLRIAALAAVVAATPAFARPCDDMGAAARALEAAIARTDIVCTTDNTLTGPCSAAIVSEHKASDALDPELARCKEALRIAKDAIGQAPDVTWSYDPPPPWRPE